MRLGKVLLSDRLYGDGRARTLEQKKKSVNKKQHKKGVFKFGLSQIGLGNAALTHVCLSFFLRVVTTCRGSNVGEKQKGEIENFAGVEKNRM